MNNLEKSFLKDKIIYKKPLNRKNNTQGIDYDIEKDCIGLIEELTMRTINGNIIKDTLFHTNIKLPLETLVRNKAEKDFFKITDINKMSTDKFGVYTYFVKRG